MKNLKLCRSIVVAILFSALVHESLAAQEVSGARGIFVRGPENQLQWKTGVLIRSVGATGQFKMDADQEGKATEIPMNEFFPAVKEYHNFHPGDSATCTNMNDSTQARRVQIHEIYLNGLVDVSGLVRVKELIRTP